MNPELAKALNELAITLIAGITTIFIPWAFALARSYAKAKVDRIQNQCVRESLEFALTRLDKTAGTVVAEVEQTRKELVADGQLSKEDARKLLSLAYTRTKARLPEDATATLQQAFGEKLQAVIVGKIESKVAVQ